MTALDIIKSFPIDEQVKMQIVNSYDSMAADTKSSLERLAWTSYRELYELTLETNLAIMQEQVKKGEEHLGKDFYARAIKKTDNEMKGNLQESLAKTDLALARKAMERIIREMSAANHPLPKLEDIDKN